MIHVARMLLLSSSHMAGEVLDILDKCIKPAGESDVSQALSVQRGFYHRCRAFYRLFPFTVYLGAVVFKLGEIFSLICCEFDSADNIAALNDLDETQGAEGVGPGGTKTVGAGQLQSSWKYGGDDDCSRVTSGSAGAPGGNSNSSSRDNTSDHEQSSGSHDLLHEIQELWEKQGQLEEGLEILKAFYQRDYIVIVKALEEEVCRCELLEEQLNDLTELHQNEILNLKEDLASMEEKTAFQSYERATNVHEALEACQTRISKMELQQQQQVEQLDGLVKTTAWTLLGKLISVLLAVTSVLLVFVSTVTNCVVPLMKTFSRMLSTLLFVLLFSFLWRHWDTISEYHHHLSCIKHPEKRDNQS
ncbi:transmembrane and coiled-coil domains protein 1-like [Toxotes jaculatrix]|uniref:transmembrane and coiled-coil domains protein 1-like n=1 Tax=Toxotes jaculatrix TaxID=941984 RepID=UPI001B3B12E2|nr:transmembrane and coiled-coil domains protein 1-like [Toxotes jaculatrix]